MQRTPRLFLFLGLSLLLMACGDASPQAVISPTATSAPIVHKPIIVSSDSSSSTTSSTISVSIATEAESPALATMTERQGGDFTARPTLLQRSLQEYFDAQRAALNDEQIQPVTLALTAQRVALVEDWALVLLAYDNAYTDVIPRPESLSSHWVLQ